TMRREALHAINPSRLCLDGSPDAFLLGVPSSRARLTSVPARPTDLLILRPDSCQPGPLDTLGPEMAGLQPFEYGSAIVASRLDVVRARILPERQPGSLRLSAGAAHVGGIGDDDKIRPTRYSAS